VLGGCGGAKALPECRKTGWGCLKKAPLSAEHSSLRTAILARIAANLADLQAFSICRAFGSAPAWKSVRTR